MAHVSSESHNGWMNLVQSEQNYYSSIGIQVSLAREIYSLGSGSDRNMRNEIVGLTFDIGPAPVPAPAQPSSSPVVEDVEIAVPIATATKAGGKMSNDMISQLERLDQLYRKGALSHGEYETAKAKVLEER